MTSFLWIVFASLCIAASFASAAESSDLPALNARAQAAHEKRNLGDSTPLYKQLLAAEPPQSPTAEQRAWVLKFAPRLFNVAGEFFPLKDIAAIIHVQEVDEIVRNHWSRAHRGLHGSRLTRWRGVGRRSMPAISRRLPISARPMIPDRFFANVI